MSTQTSLDQEPYVGTKEVAEFLGCPESWIFNNAEKTRMPRTRLPGGRLYRYRMSEIRAWLASQDQA